jgi:hypothetical protein
MRPALARGVYRIMAFVFVGSMAMFFLVFIKISENKVLL